MLGFFALVGAAFLSFTAYSVVAASDNELAEDQGRAFGSGAIDVACFTKAMAILRERRPLLIPFYESSFLDACLESSAASEGLCRGVPLPSEVEARATWSSSICRDSGTSSVACGALVTNIVVLCAERSAKTGSTPAA
jgi:hypothetical protein